MIKSLVFSTAWKVQSLPCGGNGYGCQDGAGLLATEQENGPARRNFPTLDPVEGVRCFTFNPKYPETDPVISQQRM